MPSRYAHAVSRRALTLILASVLAVGLAITGSVQTVPYVSLSAGPAYNTLGAVQGTPVLTIEGRPTYPATGALDLTTVSVKDRITLFEAVAGWLSPHEAVIPREIVFPPDQSQKQNQQENTQEMLDSQDNATTAALRELGLPSTTKVVVSSVTADAPADGKLQPGDQLTSVDGTRVTDTTQLRTLIGKHQPGDTVTVGYLRDGRPGTAAITAARSHDGGPTRAVIGILPSDRSTFPVTVDIRLASVGGPSAGLMFALGIIEKLGPDSLTGGRRIAGTGEITADGKVGIIGGIAQKMLGAKAEHATVFLSPAGNCAEAKKNKPSGLTLVKVSTLSDALAALKTLRDGGTPPSC